MALNPFIWLAIGVFSAFATVLAVTAWLTRD